MDMRLDSAFIRREREKRAWSQEHLAGASGLALRTVQRIESAGAASYDSAGAIAAAFGIAVADLCGDAKEPAGSRAGARRWISWHRVMTLLTCCLVAAILTPPNFRVTIPAALALWLGCELAILTRRGARRMDAS